MKKVLLLAVVALALLIGSSCSSDDKKEEKTTNAKILVLGPNGVATNMVVYVYDEITWDVIGDNTSFADGQAATNAEGVATFTNLEYPNTFNANNNNQNTMRFSVHYLKNGVHKTAVTPITFMKGDTKSETIILN